MKNAVIGYLTRRSIVLSAVCLLLAVCSAPAANFGTWQRKLKITFPGYTKSETLTNFPALVVLSTNITGFHYSDFLSLTNQDLRFSAADGTTELNYEIEKWETNVIAVSSPSDLSGLGLWLKADTGVLTNSSGGVTNWADQSGNSYDAAQSVAGECPTLVASALNGQPVIRFDGTDDGLDLPNISGSFPSAATFFTVVTINNDEYYSVFSTSDSETFWRFGNPPDGPTYPGMFRSARLNAFGTMTNAGTHVFAFESNASRWEWWQDGYSVNGMAVPSYSAGSSFRIAQRWDGSGGDGYLNGDIAEIIIYNRTLTATERNRVHLYLSAKYGVTLTAPMGNLSYVWVQVPAISNATNCIYAYWGKTEQTAPAYTTNGDTWSNGYVAVWHMQQTDAPDSTVQANNGIAVGGMTLALDGIAGSADVCDGSSGYIKVPDSSSLRTFTSGLTVSFWLKSYDNVGVPVSHWAGGDVGYGMTASLWVQGNGLWNSVSITRQYDGQWHHYAITCSDATMRPYTDGVASATATFSPGTFDGSTWLAMGCDNRSLGSGLVNGWLDEVRVENVGRSSNWMWACWANTESNSTFNSFDSVLRFNVMGTVLVIR